MSNTVHITHPRNVSVKSRKNFVRWRWRSSHLWSAMPGQGKSRTLVRALTISLWSSGSSFKWFKLEYNSVNSFSFQIDGGLTVPVSVHRKWEAEWTNFKRAGEASACWFSFKTGDTATIILEVRSLHWGSKVGSFRAKLWSCDSQWHQALSAAKAWACLKCKWNTGWP